MVSGRSHPAPSNGVSLTFLGAAGTVTGSKYLLTVAGRRILVDAGLFQGEKQWRLKNWEPFPVPPSSITDIVLTHAHLDHAGYLPALVKQGFRGTIWCSEGTAELVPIVLLDAAHLQEQDAQDAAQGGYSKHNPPLPLYTTADAEATLALLKPIPFDRDQSLGGGVVIRLTRSGHILGSAVVDVRVAGTSVLFSGDLGRHDHPLLKPREDPPAADWVLIESTYGDREHPEPVNLPHEAFADAIRRTVARGGSVLVPAFAVDRTELVLKSLTEMRRQGRIPEVPVYVDSPMAMRALDVYRDCDELRPDVEPGDFVDLPDLHEVTDADASRELNNPTVPCIIISASGMATGGRVLHHLEGMLPDHRHTIVLAGYQAVGTRGRALVDGARQLKMHGHYVPVKAEVVQDGEYSVHADASDLIDWLRALPRKPTTIFVTHGEPESAAALAARIESELGMDAVVPTFGEVVQLASASMAEAARVSPAPAVPEVPEVPAVPALPAVTREPELAGPQRYEVLTGPDDSTFCARVTQALAEGWRLHGSPALTFDGEHVIVAQALVR